MDIQTLLAVALLLLVLLAAITDLATRRIPNRLLAAAWLGALTLHLLSPAPVAALGAAFGGACAGLMLFMPLYLLRGMAAGDVKLMATVGLFAGPLAALQIAVLAWCAGGVMALVIIVVKGRLQPAWANVRDLLRPLLMRAAGIPAAAEPMRQPSVGSMPYGLAIALGTMAWLARQYG